MFGVRQQIKDGANNDSDALVLKAKADFAYYKRVFDSLGAHKDDFTIFEIQIVADATNRYLSLRHHGACKPPSYLQCYLTRY